MNVEQVYKLYRTSSSGTLRLCHNGTYLWLFGKRIFQSFKISVALHWAPHPKASELNKRLGSLL